MKTTIDIPESALLDAIRFTGAATKREAVVTAIEEFNRRKRMDELIAMMGQSDTFMTHEELMEDREQDKNRTFQ